MSHCEHAHRALLAVREGREGEKKGVRSVKGCCYGRCYLVSYQGKRLCTSGGRLCEDVHKLGREETLIEQDMEIAIIRN